MARASCDGKQQEQQQQRVLSLFTFIQSGKRAQMAPIEKTRCPPPHPSHPPRSIQFGVGKMDGSLPKDTEFMSLEGLFLVNRGEK